MRLMQLNIAAGNDRIAPWAERLPRIAALVERERPDVLIVQGGSPDAIDELRRHFAVLTHIARHDGMAVLSALPLDAARTFELSKQPNTDDPLHRALMTAKIGAVTLIAAHLSWNEAQADDNVREAIALAGDEGGDVLIIGDLNQQPATEAMRGLERAGFVDVWTRERHGDPGFTYPVGDLWGRLDYIWERSARPRATGIRIVAGATPVSDHLGLICEVAV